MKRRRLGAKIMLITIDPVVRSKLVGGEKLMDIREPCVFICNHSELFGPVTCVATLPFYIRPWVDERMTDKKLAKEHIMANTMSVKKWPLKTKRLYSSLAGKIASGVIKQFDPIPVGKLSMRAVSEMLNKSIQALAAGHNILIFPENSSKEKDGRYKKTGFSDFHPAFSHLAKKFYDATKEILTFYPLYADRELHILSVGDPVVYKPENNSSEECRRITSEIRNEMNKLYFDIEKVKFEKWEKRFRK